MIKEFPCAPKTGLPDHSHSPAHIADRSLCVSVLLFAASLWWRCHGPDGDFESRGSPDYAGRTAFLSRSTADFSRMKRLALDVSYQAGLAASNITAVIAGDAQIVVFRSGRSASRARTSGLKLQGVVNSSGDGGNPNGDKQRRLRKGRQPYPHSERSRGEDRCGQLLNNISDLTTKGALKSSVSIRPVSVRRGANPSARTCRSSRAR